MTHPSHLCASAAYRLSLGLACGRPHPCARASRLSHQHRAHRNPTNATPNTRNPRAATIETYEYAPIHVVCPVYCVCVARRRQRWCCLCSWRTCMPQAHSIQSLLWSRIPFATSSLRLRIDVRTAHSSRLPLACLPATAAAAMRLRHTHLTAFPCAPSRPRQPVCANALPHRQYRRSGGRRATSLLR